MRRPFNEGKALDAVLQVLEQRERLSRGDLRSPEADHHQAPIDLVCTVGDRLYALEHTGIEPFGNQIAMGQHNDSLFKPVINRLRDLLPPNAVFELHVPVNAATRTKLKPAEVTKIQHALINWVSATAPGLEMARPGCYVTPIREVTIPGVPFSVSLHRLVPLGAEFYGLSVRAIVGPDLEGARHDRIAAMCAKKYGKLQHWKLSYRARTILVLEDADIQLTNHVVVAEALARAEASRSDLPDEIYLVTSYLETSWQAICLRRSSPQEYNGLTGERWEYEKFDPAELTDLTGR